MISVRKVLSTCLNVHPPFSIKRHVLGVLARHKVPVVSDSFIVGYVWYSQVRSLKHRLDLIRTRPFVRVAILTVWPVGSNEGAPAAMQEDLDTVNAILEGHCQAWIYFASHHMVYTDRFGPFVTVDTAAGELTNDIKALLDLGKNINEPVIGYYVGRLTSAAGQASSKLRAFWLGRNPFAYERKYIFAHELCHVVGSLGHRCENQDGTEDRANLMCDTPVWAEGATLNPQQCKAFVSDQDIWKCHVS